LDLLTLKMTTLWFFETSVSITIRHGLTRQKTSSPTSPLLLPAVRCLATPPNHSRYFTARPLPVTSHHLHILYVQARTHAHKHAEPNFRYVVRK
jgi:hypothetical protein